MFRVNQFDWDLCEINRDSDLEISILNSYYKILPYPIDLTNIVLEFLHSSGYKIIHKINYLCEVPCCYEVKAKNISLCDNHKYLYTCTILNCTKPDIKKMVRDTTQTTIDGQIVEIFNQKIHYYTCREHRCKNITHRFDGEFGNLINASPIRLCKNVIYENDLCEFHYKFANGYS